MPFICKKDTMKYLLLAVGVFIAGVAKAQFGYFAQAGANYSQLRVTRGGGIQEGKGGFGGQIGGGVEYHTHFGYFLYLGANLAYESFGKDSTAIGFKSIESEYSYKPIFVSFPAGIAYQFDLSNNLGLKVYGGFTVQVGAAGTMTQRSTYYTQDSVTGAPVKVRESVDSHNMKYGKNNSKEYRFDMSNSNFALHLGAGLNFSKSAEIALFYNYGLNNILPGNEGATEVNKLGYLQLNFRVYFPKNYYSSKK